MFVGAFVCLSVCLSVSNITQNVIKGLWRNFMEWSRVAKRID